mgnify:CR=1 FL=1
MSCIHCITDENGDIKCNRHTIIDFNKREIIYEGDIKNNMANGMGKGIYTGYYFTSNSQEPIIRKFHAMYENVVYEGEWLNNRANGQGKWIGSNIGNSKTSYIGGWLNGQYHGYGTLLMYGKKYIGYWETGYKHGDMTYHDRNGDIYESKYIYNNKEGIGKYITNGKEYEVEWKNDKPYNGYHKGMCDLGWYEGYYVNGKCNGYGKLISGRNKYIGNFNNNKFHGHGIYTSKNYSNHFDDYVKDGIWENGIFMSGVTKHTTRYTIGGKEVNKYSRELKDMRKKLEKKVISIVLGKKLKLGTKNDIGQLLISVGY